MIMSSPLTPTQQGISLVELMIALTLGAIISTGIFTIYLQSQQSYKIQTALAKLQDTGRIARYFFESGLQKAGFTTHKQQQLLLLNPPFPLDNKVTPAFANKQIIAPIIKNTANTGFRVRYQGLNDGTIVNCLGNHVAANTTWIDSFEVDKINKTLRCNNTTLLTDISDIHLRYGVDSNNDTAVEHFVSHNNITDWTQIVAIRISFVVQSQQNNITTESKQKMPFPSYDPENSIICPAQHLCKVFNATYTLRNLPHY